MKKSSQPNPSPSGVLGTIAKLIRLTQKEGVEWTHWEYPTNDVTARRNLAKYLQNGCPKSDRPDADSVNYQLEGRGPARTILGDDYISPEEVATAYGVSYTDEQLRHFADTIPDANILRWLHSRDYILIAGPPTEMNLPQVWELYNEFFPSKENCWCSMDKKEKASKGDSVKDGEWLAICKKEAVPYENKEGWKRWRCHLKEIEHIPNASEVSYAVIAYLETRGSYLLCGKCVRTSSINEDGVHVYVGYFSRHGLSVFFDGKNKLSHDYIGIASARRLD